MREYQKINVYKNIKKINKDINKNYVKIKFESNSNGTFKYFSKYSYFSSCC